VLIERADIDDRAAFVENLKQGDIFAGAILAAGLALNPFTETAVSDCCILNINYQKLINPCAKHCRFHTRLTHNLLRILGQKTLQLRARFEILSKRTIRERVLAYLNTPLLRYNQSGVQPGMTRIRLAKYLSVNRSALERELTQMQKAGIIETGKGRLTLIKKEKI
jgi:CRP-like cAMP-binding protein